MATVRRLPPLLPLVRTREDYLSSPRDEAAYLPAIREICQRHGLPAQRLRKYAGGSTIVFAVGEEHVVKLFEPIFAEAAAIEHVTLGHVHGKLGVRTPGVVAASELEGWHYIVMDQLPGRSLGEVWDEIAAPERERLCARLGEAAGRLHALPAEGFSLPGPDWPVFLQQQSASCVARQRAHGLAEEWLSQIPGYLASVELPSARRVLLHTEIMRDHVVVQRGRHGWEVSGLFDFEPAMLGAPEYELPSAGIFLAGGDPALFRTFLLGYGYRAAELTPELQQRMLAYALLHRYSNLRWYLETVPAGGATTLRELASVWFAFA